MRTHSWWIVGALAIASPAIAQQAAEEGFFRPAPDPAINRAPIVPRTQPPPVVEPRPVAPDAASVAAAVASSMAVERELDRAEREHEKAREEAMLRPPPAIVSPLDGTANIRSPLDGTAPIISPLGR